MTTVKLRTQDSLAALNSSRPKSAKKRNGKARKPPLKIVKSVPMGNMKNKKKSKLKRYPKSSIKLTKKGSLKKKSKKNQKDKKNKKKRSKKPPKTPPMVTEEKIDPYQKLRGTDSKYLIRLLLQKLKNYPQISGMMGVFGGTLQESMIDFIEDLILPSMCSSQIMQKLKYISKDKRLIYLLRQSFLRWLLSHKGQLSHLFRKKGEEKQKIKYKYYITNALIVKKLLNNRTSVKQPMEEMKIPAHLTEREMNKEIITNDAQNILELLDDETQMKLFHYLQSDISSAFISQLTASIPVKYSLNTELLLPNVSGTKDNMNDQQSNDNNDESNKPVTIGGGGEVKQDFNKLSEHGMRGQPQPQPPFEQPIVQPSILPNFTLPVMDKISIRPLLSGHKDALLLAEQSSMMDILTLQYNILNDALAHSGQPSWSDPPTDQGHIRLMLRECKREQEEIARKCQKVEYSWCELLDRNEVEVESMTYEYLRRLKYCNLIEKHYKFLLLKLTAIHEDVQRKRERIFIHEKKRENYLNQAKASLLNEKRMRNGVSIVEDTYNKYHRNLVRHKLEYGTIAASLLKQNYFTLIERRNELRNMNDLYYYWYKKEKILYDRYCVQTEKLNAFFQKLDKWLMDELGGKYSEHFRSLYFQYMHMPGTVGGNISDAKLEIYGKKRFTDKEHIYGMTAEDIHMPMVRENVTNRIWKYMNNKEIILEEQRMAKMQIFKRSLERRERRKHSILMEQKIDDDDDDEPSPKEQNVFSSHVPSPIQQSRKYQKIRFAELKTDDNELLNKQEIILEERRKNRRKSFDATNDILSGSISAESSAEAPVPMPSSSRLTLSPSKKPKHARTPSIAKVDDNVQARLDSIWNTEKAKAARKKPSHRRRLTLTDQMSFAELSRNKEEIAEEQMLYEQERRDRFAKSETETEPEPTPEIPRYFKNESIGFSLNDFGGGKSYDVHLDPGGKSYKQFRSPPQLQARQSSINARQSSINAHEFRAPSLPYNASSSTMWDNNAGIQSNMNAYVSTSERERFPITPFTNLNDGIAAVSRPASSRPSPYYGGRISAEQTPTNERNDIFFDAAFNESPTSEDQVASGSLSSRVSGGSYIEYDTLDLNDHNEELEMEISVDDDPTPLTMVPTTSLGIMERIVLSNDNSLKREIKSMRCTVDNTNENANMFLDADEFVEISNENVNVRNFSMNLDLSAEDINTSVDDTKDKSIDGDGDADSEYSSTPITGGHHAKFSFAISPQLVSANIEEDDEIV